MMLLQCQNLDHKHRIKGRMVSLARIAHVMPSRVSGPSKMAPSQFRIELIDAFRDKMSEQWASGRSMNGRTM